MSADAPSHPRPVPPPRPTSGMPPLPQSPGAPPGPLSVSDKTRPIRFISVPRTMSSSSRGSNESSRSFSRSPPTKGVTRSSFSGSLSVRPNDNMMIRGTSSTPSMTNMAKDQRGFKPSPPSSRRPAAPLPRYSMPPLQPSDSPPLRPQPPRGPPPGFVPRGNVLPPPSPPPMLPPFPSPPIEVHPTSPRRAPSPSVASQTPLLRVASIDQPRVRSDSAPMSPARSNVIRRPPPLPASLARPQRPSQPAPPLTDIPSPSQPTDSHQRTLSTSPPDNGPLSARLLAEERAKDRQSRRLSTAYDMNDWSAEVAEIVRILKGEPTLNTQRAPNY